MRKRNKKYRPKVVRIPTLVRQQQDFNQVDTVLSMIERGEVFEHQGSLVMYSQEGRLYQVAPALEGWCEFWQKISVIENKHFDDHALQALIKKINYDIPIGKADIEKAREVVEHQRRLFMTTPLPLIAKVAQAMQDEIRKEAVNS